jgi:multiple sugar transport system permease protein
MNKIKKHETLTHRLSSAKKILIYSFLILFGVSMIVPFLWMVSTALKGDDEVAKPNWIPTNKYVEYAGELVEVNEIYPSSSKPGLYTLKVLDGPFKGDLRDVSTSELTSNNLIKNRYSFAIENESGKKIVCDAQLISKKQPLYYEIKVSNPNLPEETIQLELPETEVVNKVALQWKNFPKAIKASGVFTRSFINSIVIAILVTIGQVFTSSLAAYGFARLRFPGRNALFMGYLTTMMIPGAVTMIPVFVILKAMPEIGNAIFNTAFFSSSLFVQFGDTATKFYAGKPIGLDSYFAMIAPGLFSAYGTFMLRQFFMGLPVDLEDAAKIDGCNLFRVYTNVILPLSKPALATLTIFTFMGSWRNFMWPLVVSSTPEMQTLPVMLQTFVSLTRTEYNLLMACNLMVMAPLIIVFLGGQRFFIEGIQLGAVKG